MNLIDVVGRHLHSIPWAEGEKIPWNDPGFSARMLREHLSQEHDAASRRYAIIDRQVEWIYQVPLCGQPARILDLGCGPGLYTSRLAVRGCHCAGIDFSPASIAYAREYAQSRKLDCHYIEGDLRTAKFRTGFYLVMFIFGELNVFRSQDARILLNKAHGALNQDGLLILELHSFETVRKLGEQPSSWYSASSGLFSESPHLCCQENFWDESSCTATCRYFIVDATSGEVTRYAATVQAYTRDQYRAILQECGFQMVEFHPSLEGKVSQETQDFLVITAKK